MIQTRGQRIGKRGEDLFRVLLPDSWLTHKRDPDPHVDFVVEPIINGELSPKPIYVQVRTIERLGSRSPFIKLDISGLRYSGICRVPVFGVCVALDSKRGYFLDMTQFASSLASSHKIWTQSTTRQAIPHKDSLSDETRLLQAIESSWQLLDEKYPGSLMAAAGLASRTLEKNDPRIVVKTKFDGEKTSFDIASKSGDPIEFTLHIKGDSSNVKSNVERLLAEGGSLGIDDGLEVRASNLPGHYGKTIPLDSINATQSTSGAVAIRFRGKGGEMLGGHRFPVTWVGGAKKRKARLEACEIPVFSGNHTLELTEDQLAIEADFNLNLSSWEGVSVWDLPSFGNVEAFLGSAEHAAEAICELEFDGANYGDRFSENEFDFLRWMSRVVNLTRKLREIARKRDVELRWDYKQLADNELLIDQIHELVTTGKVSLGAGTGNFLVETSKTVDELRLEDSGKTGTVKFMPGSGYKEDHETVLGVDLGLGVLEQRGEKCKITGYEQESDGLVRVRHEYQDWVLVWREFEQD